MSHEVYGRSLEQVNDCIVSGGKKKAASKWGVLISKQEAFNHKVRQENREARGEKTQIRTLPEVGSVEIQRTFQPLPGDGIL